VSGGPWQPLDASAPAGGIVDQAAPNGQAVDYRVSAITAGVQPTLLSVSSAPGSAVPDATAPDVPNEVTPPDFVNQGNENAVPVKVFLPQTSAPTDVVSVTLTNPTTGDSASATTAGGQSPVSVTIDTSKIAELLHYKKNEGPLDPRVRMTTARKGYSIEKLEFLSEPGIHIPTWVFKPEMKRESYPAILYVNESGKQADGMEFGLCEKLARQGNLIVAVDVRGIGETRPAHDNALTTPVSGLYCAPLAAPAAMRRGWQVCGPPIKLTEYGESLYSAALSPSLSAAGCSLKVWQVICVGTRVFGL